jgi:peptidoglycan/xylan/chitin deacetylase (PgdA/CDA1 family)
MNPPMNAIPPSLMHRFQTRLVRAACRLPGVTGRIPGDGIHLTFDDGPGPGTERMLSILATRGIRATFFLLGDAARADPGAVQAIRSAGHAVGAHGMAHIDAWRHPGAAVRDMAAGCALLEDLLGEPVSVVRPPYGRLSPGVWRWARSTGREVLLWDVDALDYRSPRRTPGRRAPITPLLRPGSIVLLHENAAAWAEWDARAWLDGLGEAGWTFQGGAWS